MTKVPIGIRKLSNLKELVLDENLFEDIPINRLSGARSIETVSFNKSPRITISKGNYSRLDFIKVFKANNCGLKSVDPFFYRMSGVEDTQLQENKLEVIPDGISKLDRLTRLSFYKNELKSLPNDLFNLKNLVVIDLYFNRLEVIPEEIGQLKTLEILYLASNRIYDLPESIGQLINLSQLYIHRNRLSAIPESIGNLENLKVFRVNENCLIGFPLQVLGLKKLEYLDISDNQITTIPKEVKSLDKLKLFTYNENLVDFDRPENRHLAPMIVRMTDSGTICIPRVYYAEEVGEPATMDSDSTTNKGPN